MHFTKVLNKTYLDINVDILIQEVWIGISHIVSPRYTIDPPVPGSNLSNVV